MLRLIRVEFLSLANKSILTPVFTAQSASLWPPLPQFQLWNRCQGNKYFFYCVSLGRHGYIVGSPLLVEKNQASYSLFSMSMKLLRMRRGKRQDIQQENGQRILTCHRRRIRTPHQYQRNVNENNAEISFSPTRLSKIQMFWWNHLLVGMWKNQEPFCAARGHITCMFICRTIRQDFVKLSILIPSATAFASPESISQGSSPTDAQRTSS